MDDLKTFFESVATIASDGFDAIQSGESDVMGELEVTALQAAANAFACYQLARAVRREHDARQAAAEQPAEPEPMLDPNLN